MATNDSLKNQLADNQTQQVADPSKLGFKALMSTPTMKKKFEDILKEKSDPFMGSLMTLVAGDSYLSQANPMTIVAAALKAATMDLPIDKNLGYAYIVPFNRNEKVGNRWVKHNEAQFILGYKGYIQLAQRSGQYKALNVIPVHEGQLSSWNPLTEEFDFNYEGKISDDVIGYVGFFELLNGYRKTVYWTKQEIEAHRIKNAKGKDKEKLSGAWVDNYDAMACKTVLRNMLSKWGILSIEMQNAVVSDEKTFTTSNDGDLVEEVDIKEAEVVDDSTEDSVEILEENVVEEKSKKDLMQEAISQNDEEVQNALFDDKQLGKMK